MEYHSKVAVETTFLSLLFCLLAGKKKSAVAVKFLVICGEVVFS